MAARAIGSNGSGGAADPARPAVTVVDPALLRSALGSYPSGLTIVAGADGTGPVGFTCQSFHSVSLDPPLISLGIMKSSTSFPPIRDSGTFSISVMSAHQADLAIRFASRRADRWTDVTWRPDALGNPIIDGALVSLSCELWAEYDAGDHIIALGLVREIHQDPEASGHPLVYFRSEFRVLE